MRINQTIMDKIQTPFIRHYIIGLTERALGLNKVVLSFGIIPLL